MATNKQIINTRFANKSDTSANWNIASNAAKPFTPLKGEILFYTDLNKIKIGDGEHTPNQLEFISDIDLSKYMLKSTYDANGDGIVDNAEKLGGVAASEYAKKTDVPTVPTNVSAFTNDAGYLTSYTETDPTVPSHVKGITTGDITNWNAKATTNYVDTKVAGIVDTAPEALNTLNELAAALGDDPNFATTVMTEIGKKVDKTTTVNGHALSGDVTVSKSDVGLGNVDNTADENKSVKYAVSAETTTKLSYIGLGSSASNASMIKLVYEWTISNLYAGCTGLYAICDNETCFNGILSVRFRNADSATKLGEHELAWIAASRTPPKEYVVLSSSTSE